MFMNYTVISIKTSGLALEYFDEILEIGAIKLNENSILKEFHKICKSFKKIPISMQNKIGLTKDVLEKAEPSYNVLSQFRQFVGDDILICYNANFVLDFLNYWFYKFKLKPISKSICLMNDFKTNTKIKVKLLDVANIYHLDYKENHSSLIHAKLINEIFLKMKNDEFQFEVNNISNQDIYIRHKSRIINAKHNAHLLLQIAENQPVEKNLEKFYGIKEKVFKLFDEKKALSSISELMKVDQSVIYGFFLKWVNGINFKKYKYLFPESLFDYIKELAALSNNCPDTMLAINQAICKKKNKDAYPEFLIRVILKLLNPKEQFYRLNDLRPFFDSGYSLKTLTNQYQLSPRNLGIQLGNWVIENPSNQKKYEKVLKSLILPREHLESFNKLSIKDKQIFIKDLPKKEQLRYYFSYQTQYIKK